MQRMATRSVVALSIVLSCSCTFLTDERQGDPEQAFILYITAPDTAVLGETFRIDLHHPLGHGYLDRVDAVDIENGVALTVWHEAIPDNFLFCGTPPQPVLATYTLKAKAKGDFKIVVHQPDSTTLEKTITII